MSRTLFSLLFASCLSPVPACAATPAPAPLPVGDAGQDDADRACSALAKLTCPDGLASNCAVILRKVVTDPKPITKMDLLCIQHAATQDAVRACGSVCR